MGFYIAKSKNSRDFQLFKSEEYIGKLVYPKWFSFESKIYIGKDETYDFVQKGMWGTSIELNKGNDKLLDFKLNWNGVLITIYYNNEILNFILKLKGVMSGKYVLIDTKNNIYLELNSKMQWKYAHFEYRIETFDVFEALSFKNILLISIFHAINYHINHDERITALDN